jgi:circadian clock protein KaiC
MEEQNSLTTDFLATGVPGLDAVLGGGLTRDRLYLVEGEPGTGKTTLALQFLNEGVRHGESTLYITLAETVVELRSVAQSHGWRMDHIHIEEIIPDEKYSTRNSSTPSSIHRKLNWAALPSACWPPSTPATPRGA